MKLQTPYPSWGESGLLFFFSMSDHSLESKEKPYSKSPARNTKRARRGEGGRDRERKERKECQNKRTMRKEQGGNIYVASLSKTITLHSPQPLKLTF